MMSLDQIKAQVDLLAARVGASEYILPTYGRTEDGARPHIEVDRQAYHYVIVERGQELERVTTNELEELLYTIFKGVTFSLAIRYELKHRIEGQDCRRIVFQRQVELLSALSAEWGERESRRHKEILQRHPYDDAASIRADLTEEYRRQGWSPEEAQRKAFERYPLPGTKA
jgi:hypothetical protein